MQAAQQNPNLIIKNGVYLFIRLLLVLFLAFFTTRLTLQVLGDEKYGIYNIVGGIIAVFAIISLPIRDALQRFFNVEFAKGNLRQGVVFLTASRIVLYMVITITILYETIGLYLINFIIQYPQQEKMAVNVIFQLSAIANILGFLALPYISLLFSKENMGIPAICEIVGSILKIALLYLIPFIPINVLIPYASIFLLINLFIYFFYRVYCRKKYADSFSEQYVDSRLQKNMLSFSGWSFVESVSGISLTYIPNIFINIFGGVLYNTAYGISKQLQNAVISFSSNVLKAADPQITSSTAINNDSYRNQLVLTTAKVSFIAVAFVYILFHVDGDLLLGLWLKDVPKYAFPFCEIMLLDITISSASLPFRTLLMATGKIKSYFTSYGIVSIFSLLLMYSLLKIGYPVITTLYIILLSTFMKSFMLIIYVNKETSLQWFLIFKNLMLSVLPVILAGMIYFYLNKYVCLNLIYKIVAFVFCGLILLFFTYYIALNTAEKNKVKSVFKRIIINFYK